MSDYYGSGQTRVLTVEDRSIDNVIFQYRMPPLSSEWNLINQIGNLKNQEASRNTYPSGWFKVGDVCEEATEADAVGGQVLTSAAYAANSFKLVSSNDNIAMVHGWPILVQGYDSGDDNNVIQLSAPGYGVARYDFVYLEVWHKLVAYNESLYPYGNVTKTPYTDNEIKWAAIGTETTKRVQLQYRIRIKSIPGAPGVLDGQSDVFSDVSIYAIGGRVTGEYAFPLGKFAKYGAGDIGLYRAGDGTSNSQTELVTVDGYVYAIPMFLVYRRSASSSLFSPTQMSAAYTDKTKMADSTRSDRPDQKISDIIYKDDIVDFRHKILTSGKDVSACLEKTFSKLVAGELTTALKRGFDANGADSNAVSGGSALLKVERVNSVGGDNIPNVGTGCGINPSNFKRRAFCNAEITHDHNVIEIPGPTGIVWPYVGKWMPGETISLSTGLNPGVSLPDGTVKSIDGFYSKPTIGYVTDIGVTGVNGETGVSCVYVSSGSNLVNSTDKLYMEYTFEYNSSTYGFKDVPKEFLEVNKGTALPIATRDNNILLRFNSAGDLLVFDGSAPNNGDTTVSDYVRYAGGNYTENSEFGHELVIYRTLSAGSGVLLSLTSSKLNGYYIHGVKSVQVETAPGVGTYKNPEDFTVSRLVADVIPTSITSYSVATDAANPNLNVKITLYTGSINIGNTYSVANSFKFFELSKQGRGVIDTYEMIDVIATEDTPGNYTIDTGDKPIIAIMTKTTTTGGYVTATPYGFNTTGVVKPLTSASVDINNYLPILSSSSYSASMLPTKIIVTANLGEGTLRIPVLVHSYVTSSESSYNFYYKFSPYQGILKSTSSVYGGIVQEGPAAFTSLGSGAVVNYTYSTGTALFTLGSRTVTGSASTKWLSHAKAGDFIKVTGTAHYYRILSVGSDISLTLAETFTGATTTTSYEIMRMDIPENGISNVIDRLPTYCVADATYITDDKCLSNDMVTYGYDGALKLTKPLIKVNDPLNAILNDFIVGTSGKSNSRGRYNFVLSSSGNDAFKINTDGSTRPHITYEYLLGATRYKKVCQVYLFQRSGKSWLTSDNALTGRLYMMVVVGETLDSYNNTLSTFSNIDSVDIYELAGRPILKAD